MPKPASNLLQEDAVDERVRVVLEADSRQFAEVNDAGHVVPSLVRGLRPRR